LAPRCAGLREPKWSGLGLLKSAFNVENFVGRLFWTVFSHFGAIYSKSASRRPKSLKITKTPYFGDFKIIQGQGC